MMHHIDVSSVLHQTLACDLYSNLVTRSTGAAVRDQIELLLEECDDRPLAVIDFSHVSMIDFSCADEVVAKLLLRYANDDAPREAYFLFRGVTERHWDAIEAVLERHGLALALESPDGVRLMGVLDDDERRVWELANRVGRVDAAGVARATNAEPRAAEGVLESLCRRRLLMRVDDRYVVVGSPDATH